MELSFEDILLNILNEMVTYTVEIIITLVLKINEDYDWGVSYERMG